MKALLFNKQDKLINHRQLLGLKSLIANSRLLMIQMDSMEQIFGKTAQMTVLKNLIEKKNEPTYLSGIAEETGLSHASVSRVITPLIAAGIVREKLLGKQIRTFQLNMENEATNVIIDFYNKINQIIRSSGN